MERVCSCFSRHSVGFKKFQNCTAHLIVITVQCHQVIHFSLLPTLLQEKTDLHTLRQQHAKTLHVIL